MGRNRRRRIRRAIGGLLSGNLIVQAVSVRRAVRRSNRPNIPRRPVTTNEFVISPPPPPVRVVQPTPRPVVSIVVPPSRNSTETKPPNSRYSDDILDMTETSVNNNQFEAIEKNGVSSFRPEIIAVADFVPVYKGKTQEVHLTDGGLYMQLQNQMLEVRRETLVRNLSSLSKWNSKVADEAFVDVDQSFNKELQRTTKTTDFYERFISALESSKENLNIRNVATIPDIYGRGEFLSMPNFFEKSLQFSKANQQFYSNTKLFLQFCSDLRAVLENYSFELLDLSDSDRVNDTDPIDVDNTYTTKDGFSFSIDLIRSLYTPQNASNSVIFNSTLSSLPHDPADRIKLLVTLLSKEYRVSKNLSNSGTSKVLLDKFSQENSGNPFDNITGIPGDTIFDSPTGANSLSSLAHVGLGSNAIVLPFEKKYVDTDTSGKTFVPGSSYFFDTILASSTATEFNTKPYVDFCDRFTDITNSATSMINTLLQLEDKNSSSRINPKVMIDSFLFSTKTSISGLLETKSINKDQGATLALIKLANTDSKLKNMLFQFVIFAGIASQTPTDQKKVFADLASELKTTSAISYARIIARLSVDLTDESKRGILQSYLQDLAQDIEDRVFLLVSGRAIPKRTVSTKLAALDSSYSSVANLGLVNFDLDRRVIFLDDGNIKTILMSMVVPSSNATTTILKEFLNIANELTIAANTNGVSSYLLPDGSGRTRYNFLSTSMQLLLMFEVISSLSEKFTFANFAKAKYANKILLEVDARSNHFMHESISQVLVGFSAAGQPPPPAPPVTKASSQQAYADAWNASLLATKAAYEANLPQNRLSNYQTTENARLAAALTAPVKLQTPPGPEHIELKNSLTIIISKITNENEVISKFLKLINQFNGQLRNGKTILLNTFNSTTLQNFLVENSVVDLNVIKNPSQLRTSTYLFRELTSGVSSETSTTNENSKFEKLIIDDNPIQEKLMMLSSLLKEPQYGIDSRADERLRIISVGIPAGMSKKLSERIQLSKINRESFFDRQSDVIKIKIYKRDSRFGDIVFKPKTFLFDLSLFQSTQEIKRIQPRDGESFEQLLGRDRLSDLQVPKKNVTSTLETLKTNSTYSFLADSQKTSLFYNHVQSYLLETYLMLMTGMKLREETFTTDDIGDYGLALNAKLESALKSYIQNTYSENVGNLSMQQVLSSETISQEAKDVANLFTYGSKKFEPSIMRKQVVGPKLFDRIFHIPMSTEGFEIDFELTRATDSGRQALVQNFIQEKISETEDGKTLFQSTQQLDDVVFADFFASIETDF